MDIHQSLLLKCANIYHVFSGSLVPELAHQYNAEWLHVRIRVLITEQCNVMVHSQPKQDAFIYLEQNCPV